MESFRVGDHRLDENKSELELIHNESTGVDY